MTAMRAATFASRKWTRCARRASARLDPLGQGRRGAELPGDNMASLFRPGFNVIGTANTRDQGVNELSAALGRRFNYVHPDRRRPEDGSEDRAAVGGTARTLQPAGQPACRSSNCSRRSSAKSATARNRRRQLEEAEHDAFHRRSDRGGTRRDTLPAVLRRKEVGPADIARNMVGGGEGGPGGQGRAEGVRDAAGEEVAKEKAC